MRSAASQKKEFSVTTRLYIGFPVDEAEGAELLDLGLVLLGVANDFEVGIVGVHVGDMRLDGRLVVLRVEGTLGALVDGFLEVALEDMGEATLAGDGSAALAAFGASAFVADRYIRQSFRPPREAPIVQLRESLPVLHYVRDRLQALKYLHIQDRYQ